MSFQSLSEEQYGLIQDCFLSPKGVPKKEFAERLLELTEPNTPSNIEETPLQSPGGPSERLILVISRSR